MFNSNLLLSSPATLPPQEGPGLYIKFSAYDDSMFPCILTAKPSNGKEEVIYTWKTGENSGDAFFIPFVDVQSTYWGYELEISPNNGVYSILYNGLSGEIPPGVELENDYYYMVLHLGVPGNVPPYEPCTFQWDVEVEVGG